MVYMDLCSKRGAYDVSSDLGITDYISKIIKKTLVVFYCENIKLLQRMH